MRNPVSANKKMSPEVFKLRRKVIDIIHDAKRLTDLPRVNVRVTEDNKKHLATALTGKDAYVIWIPEPTFGKYTDNDLKFIIFHELLHTIYGIPHKDKGIMQPKMQTGHSSKELDKMFLTEVNKVKGRFRLSSKGNNFSMMGNTLFKGGKRVRFTDKSQAKKLTSYLRKNKLFKLARIQKRQKSTRLFNGSFSEPKIWYEIEVY